MTSTSRGEPVLATREPGLDEIARLAATALQAPAATVTVTQDDGGHLRVDYRAERRLVGALGAEPASWGSAPITAGGRILGSLEVLDPAPRSLDTTQQTVLAGLAALAGRLLELRGLAPEGRPRCALGGSTVPCDGPAELKIADPWGDSAWGCAEHVEEALLHARGVFLADQNAGVLAAFLHRP